MRDIYENIVIGNFLLCFGHKLGKYERFSPFSVNLIQQTPADSRLGDVLMGSARVAMLIEFKRSANKAGKDKEIKKCRAIIEQIERMQEEERKLMQKTSQAVHWYAQSSRDGEEFKFCASEYLKLEDKARNLGFFRFVDKAAAVLARTTYEDFPTVASITQYMGILADVSKEKKDSSSGGLLVLADVSEKKDSSSGGLLVSVTEKGDLNLAATDDFTKFLPLFAPAKSESQASAPQAEQPNDPEDDTPSPSR